ncbi:hypothetical protein BX666DRAFT_1275867 [Dichotomocladium elegans]|nr:hypothetical protein BX666DRAFT_1275867 [Dichotomocladium elegans]
MWLSMATLTNFRHAFGTPFFCRFLGIMLCSSFHTAGTGQSPVRFDVGIALLIFSSFTFTINCLPALCYVQRKGKCKSQNSCSMYYKTIFGRLSSREL